jgi:hypothetical protein
MFGPPPIEWNKTYAGIAGDSVVQTFDEGYALAGFTADSYGCADLLLIKTDSKGNMEWSKTYGGRGWDVGRSIVQASDGSYLIAGDTNSSTNSGYSYGWLVKTDYLGNMLWNRTYGSAYGGGFFDVVRTMDGGYTACGVVGGQPWLIKTDVDGNPVWNKTFDIVYPGWAVALMQTNDGGYILGGHTSYFSYTHTIPNKFWIVRTDSFGNTLWERDLTDQSDPTWLYSIIETSDQGFFAAGGDRLVKVDSRGNVEWEKRYASIQTASPPGVVEAIDRGIVIASFDYIAKIDAFGNMLWNQTTDGSARYAYSMVRTKDGGYAVTGQTAGGVWLMKVAPDIPFIPTALLLFGLVLVAAVVFAVIFMKRKSIKGRARSCESSLRRRP